MTLFRRTPRAFENPNNTSVRDPSAGGDQPITEFVSQGPAHLRALESTSRRARFTSAISTAVLRLSSGWAVAARLPILNGFESDDEQAGGWFTREVWTRGGPYGLVAVMVGFGLVALRSARLAVAFPNDESVHVLMVSDAAHQWSTGHFPLDSWFPFLSMGSPFFLHYQSTPAILTGLLGWAIGVSQAFGWTLYLLLALWPLSVYWGGRLLGWERWTSACAAAMAPLLVSIGGYGFGHQAYEWRGNGIWSQLWGMWVLPLAWGFAWRAVSQRRYVYWAIISLSLVVAFHFLTAYLAGLTVILWAFMRPRPREILRRLKTAVIIGVGAGLATLWVTWPIFATGKWSALNEFNAGTFFANSYGARQVLIWLIHGQLFDSGRFPIITILFAVGLVVSLIRCRVDERSRALLAVFVVSLLLFFGETTFGSLVDVLPGHSQLLFHRYIMGVQLAGLFLAGVGLVALARIAAQILHKVVPERATLFVRRPLILATSSFLIGAVGLFTLTPAWENVGNYDTSNAVAIVGQQISDATQGADLNVLLQVVRTDGGGRVFAGLPTSPAPWGYSFTVGQVPLYIYLANAGLDAIGFSLRTSSLMTDPEAYFNSSNLGDYEMFGIHYLIVPPGFTPPVPAHFVEQSGSYLLYTVGTSGYAQVIDTTSPISENANNIGAETSYLMNSNLPATQVYPTVAYDGETPATPTLAQGTTVPPGTPGRVVSEKDNLVEGEVTTRVSMNRRAVVLLKASYDPGWKATIDGVPASTQIIAPALVGVAVPSGVHTVRFQYHSYSYYPELFAISLLSLVGMAAGPWIWRRRHSHTKRDADTSI